MTFHSLGFSVWHVLRDCSFPKTSLCVWKHLSGQWGDLIPNYPVHPQKSGYTSAVGITLPPGCPSLTRVVPRKPAFSNSHKAKTEFNGPSRNFCTNSTGPSNSKLYPMSWGKQIHVWEPQPHKVPTPVLQDGQETSGFKFFLKSSSLGSQGHNQHL